MEEKNYMTLRVKDRESGEFREVKYYPDLMPKDGETALIFVSDNKTETTKPLIRSISVNDEGALIVPGIDETTPYELITDSRYSVTFCGVIAESDVILYEGSHINKAAYLPNAELQELFDGMMKREQSGTAAHNSEA